MLLKNELDKEHEIRFSGLSDYEGQPKVTTDVKTNAVTLDEILLVFEDFLRGMGFHFKGHVDIVDDEAQD